MDGRTDGQAGRQADRQTDRQTDRHVDRRATKRVISFPGELGLAQIYFENHTISSLNLWFKLYSHVILNYYRV